MVEDHKQRYGEEVQIINILLLIIKIASNRKLRIYSC